MSPRTKKLIPSLLLFAAGCAAALWLPVPADAADPKPQPLKSQVVDLLRTQEYHYFTEPSHAQTADWCTRSLAMSTCTLDSARASCPSFRWDSGWAIPTIWS